MDPDEALAYLESLEPTRVELALDTVERLLAELDDPQLAYPVIHVGGTNGKGSVVAHLEAILREAGLRVGAYTSPHLLDYGERVRVDGEPLAPEDLARLVGEVRPAVEAASTEADPVTYFEAGTALAFQRFREAQVDVAILEVGMGGRLDATNVVPDPWCTVVTNVSLEHTKYLGDTVEQVAGEKAAILKPGVPCVTGCDGAALEVVRERAAEVGAPLWVLGDDVQLRDVETSLEGTRFRLEGPGVDRDLGVLETPLAGAHQARNAALAVKVAEVLEHEGHASVPPEAVRAGLAATRWPGRLQIVPGEPPILLDGAHNPAAARALGAFLQEQGLDEVTLLFAVLEDKDLPGIVAGLAPVAKEAVVTRASSPRSRHPRDGARAFSEGGVVATVVEDLGHALATARGQAGEDGFVVVTGSLAFVGDVLRHLRKQRAREGGVMSRVLGWFRRTGTS